MRTITNVLLVLVGLALLSACADSSATGPTVVKDCMTSSGQMYNCESPSDTLPACRIEVGCVPILPPPKEDSLPGCRPEVGCFPNLPIPQDN